MRFKQGLLLTLGLAAVGSAQAVCDVTVAAIHPNGNALLLADCATAITNINWKLDGNSIEGDISPTNATGTTAYYTTPLVSGTHSYTATANAGAVAAGKPATVTTPNPVLTVAATEGGTVTSNVGGINCTSTGGAGCTASFASGAAVTLTAAKDSTHSWGGWGGDCSGSATVCALTMNGTRTVSANFGPMPVNGACGSDSNATPVASAPTDPGLCAAGGTATAVADPASAPYNFTWGCNGANGGTDTSATACSAPKIVAGTCGSANGATGLTTAPSAGSETCATGSLNGSVTAADPNFTWTCAGANGGATSPTCSAAMASVNGQCGTPAASATPPSSGLCTQGIATAVTTNATTYSWGCNGQAGGTSTAAGACTSPRIVNGVCGSANGVAVATAPSSGLCSAGTPSAVAGSGPFTWTCADINDSSPANCSAPLLEAGACGATPGNYTVLDYPNYSSSTFTNITTIPPGQGLAYRFTINKTTYPLGYKLTDAVGGSKSYKISKCPGGTDGPVDGQNGSTSVNGDAKLDNCQMVNAYVRYKETSGVSPTYYNSSNLLFQTTCFLPTTTTQGGSTPGTYYLNIFNTGTSTVSIQFQNQAQLN